MKIRKVGLGSTNPVKYRAVCDVLHRYFGVMPCQVNQMRVESGVNAQPIGSKEVFLGAKNRAMNAFHACDLSVGVESGLIDFGFMKDKYLNACVCTVYDGERFSYGVSQAFSLPPEVLERVLKGEGNVEIDEALMKTGLSGNPNIGEDVGLVGLLTKSRVVREDLVREAVTMAVIPFTNLGLYFR